MHCLGKTSIVSKQTPLFLYSGDIILTTTGGEITHSTLTTHDVQVGPLERNQTILENALKKQLALKRYRYCIYNFSTI